MFAGGSYRWEDRKESLIYLFSTREFRERVTWLWVDGAKATINYRSILGLA